MANSLGCTVTSFGATPPTASLDDIFGRLASSYASVGFEPSQAVRITKQDVAEWSQTTGLSRSALYDAIALKLASGFQSGAFDFGFCDWIVNDLIVLIWDQYQHPPELFWAVFLAFDAGEYQHASDDGSSVDPVEAYTRPQLARILREQMPD